MHGADVFFIVTARSYWLWHERIMYCGDIRALEIEFFEQNHYVELTRADDEIVGSGWRHETKHGKPDLRYGDNPRVWEVRRHFVVLDVGGLKWQVDLYSNDNACRFANALSAISGQGPSLVYDDEAGEAPDADGDAEWQDEEPGGDEQLGDEEEAPREWHEVLGTAPDASADAIKAAYRERLKEYHPDRVAHLGEKLRTLAGEEALAINEAYAEAMRLR